LAKDIVKVLEKLPLESRELVKEVTLDMANNMESAVTRSFPSSLLVIDHFHVVQLVLEALQHVRIKYRWEELEKENDAIEKAKKSGKRHKSIVLPNGDTPKQLLARSRYVIMKKPTEWTESQKQRAELLFEMYPLLKTAYYHTLEFRSIYELKGYDQANLRIIEWINKTNGFNIKEFNTAANTIKNNLNNILNFFINRHTNANAESFNSKIKLFRANLRGVVDTKFFLFRLEKLFA